MKLVTLYSGSTGLNTVLDPQRLSQGSDKAPGVIELAQAVNVSIDDRGLVTLRNGDTLKQSGEFHSLFCDGGDCYVVQERTSDAAIMRVGADLSLTGVRSSLAQDKRMAWCQINGDTFYSNGVQNGYIRQGVSYPWAVGSYRGPDADLVFESSIPLASHIGLRPGGQMLLAEGQAIWINHLPFQFGLYNKRSGYIGFGSDVRMIAVVQAGFFASDAEQTWFFRKMDGWYNYKQEQAEAAPVVPHSLAHNKVALRDAGVDSPGFGRVWASTRGICIGTDDGNLINLTEEQVVYPQDSYTAGACLIRGKKIINTTI